MLSRRRALLTSLFLLVPGLARAKKEKDQRKAKPQQTVRMYKQHPEDPKEQMVFLPRVVRVPATSTVRFEPVDAGHNCVSTPGMIPDGATSWSGPFGKPLDVHFEKPGYYGYHCLAHRSMGMVGLVIVEGPGRDDNLKAASSVEHTGRAAEVWKQIWAGLEASAKEPKAVKRTLTGESTK